MFDSVCGMNQLLGFVLCFSPVRQPVGGSAVPHPKGRKGGMWKSFLVVNVFRCSLVGDDFKMSLWAPHTFWCGVLTPDVPSASRCDYPGLFMFNPFGILPHKNSSFRDSCYVSLPGPALPSRTQKAGKVGCGNPFWL